MKISKEVKKQLRKEFVKEGFYVYFRYRNGRNYLKLVSLSYRDPLNLGLLAKTICMKFKYDLLITNPSNSFKVTGRLIDISDRDQTSFNLEAPLRKRIPVGEFITVSDLAQAMEVKGADVIKRLFINGIMAVPNQSLDFDTAFYIAEEFGHDVIRKETNLLTLEGWQMDLVEEHDRLHGKTNELFKFFHTDKFNKLPLEEQYLIVTKMKKMADLGQSMADLLVYYNIAHHSKVKLITVN